MSTAAENILIRQKAVRLLRKHFGKLLLMALLAVSLCLTLLVFGLLILFVTTGGPWSSTAHVTNAVGINHPYTFGLWVLWLLVAFVGSGLLQGLISTMLRLCRGDESSKQGYIFSCMRYSPKAFGLSLWCAAALLLWMIPGYLLMMGGSMFGAVAIDSNTGVLHLTPQEQQVIGAVILCGLILCTVLGIPAFFRHMLAPFMLSDEPSAWIWDCAARSKAMMKGRKWQLFRLLLPDVLLLAALVMSLLALGDIGLRLFRSDLASGLINTLLPLLCLALLLIFLVRTLLSLCLFYLLCKDAGPMPAPPADSSAAIPNGKVKETDHEEPVC